MSRDGIASSNLSQGCVYISDLKARLPKPAADAALKRLDDAVAHAKKLAAEGKVVSAAWLDHDMQRSIAGEIPQNRKPGCMKIPKNEANDPEYNKAGAKSVGMDAYYISKDYFVRDLVRAVAKDGWFKEEPAKA